MEDELSILGSRWKELQGKKVDKVPQIIIDRNEAINSLLHDVGAVMDEKDGKTKSQRLMKNIAKLQKVNDEEKRKLGLQVTEYFTSRPETVKSPRPRDRIARKSGAARRVRNALNPL